MNKKIILDSKNRVNQLTSANDCEFYIDWGSILDDGKYRVNYSICKQIRDIPLSLTFTQLLINRPPWARYNASSFNATTQILSDLTGNGRNATCVSCVISTQLQAINGSGVPMTSVTGSAGASSIQFPVGSCPANHTICFITRYRGAIATQKTILKNEVGDYFGHNTARRGIVNYGENIIANGVTTAPVISYLNMCVSSSLPAPDNVLVNEVPNGIIGVAPIVPFTSTLSINVNGGTEASGFELNQLIIWDRALTSAEMTIVSSSFTRLLATGILA